LFVRELKNEEVLNEINQESLIKKDEIKVTEGNKEDLKKGDYIFLLFLVKDSLINK